MGEITLNISMNANFIYHMLSVSKVGYDNSYGDNYLYLHDKNDMEILKKYEDLLTVAGGKYVGDLYGFITAIAVLDDSIILEDYLQSILLLFENNDIKNVHRKYRLLFIKLFETADINLHLKAINSFYEKFKKYKKEMVEITKVLLKNLSIFKEEVWKIEKIKLEKRKDMLIKEINNMKLINRWEDLLKFDYPYRIFEVILCNSIENGPQAIDVSEYQDIFYSDFNNEILVNFISHEIGIYMLKSKLKQNYRDNLINIYKEFESLAGALNEIVLKREIKSWSGDLVYKKFYKRLVSDNNIDIDINNYISRAIKEVT